MAKILLAEDEQALREAYAIVLSSQGFELSVAANGAEALGLYEKYTYDLVLLDLMMPQLDGLGFLKLSNATKRTNGTRIIAFSNLSSGYEAKEALRLGANKHILKSNFSPSELGAFIKSELAV